MTPELCPTTVLRQTDWCVVRPQEEQHVIYNSRTDELHLVSPEGYYVYQWCDGLQTLREIQTMLRGATGEDAGVVRTRLYAFLDRLIQRGILEVDSHA
jgi:hypothetical protein